MSTLLRRVEWRKASAPTTAIEITDALTLNINKSTEIQNNIADILLKNSPVSLSNQGDIIGQYVDPTTEEIIFHEDDEFKIWCDFASSPADIDGSWYDDDNLLGIFSLEEFQQLTTENTGRIQVKSVDTAYLLFNKIYNFSYGVSNNFTAPGIVRHASRKFGEKNATTVTTYAGTDNDTGTLYAVNAKFVSEGGYIQDYRSTPTTTLGANLTAGGTTVTVASTTGFETEGTLVIGSEHIAYTGKNATQFTGCTRGIDDTLAEAYSSGTAVYQGFPLVLMAKIWKPIFEWIGEISQTEQTNYLDEVQEGGTPFYDRAFIYFIDEQNSPHWFYPDDTPDLTIELAEEGRRGFRLEKAVFDAVNFVIYNGGEDMYGNGILHYWFDPTSEVSSMKMRYQPMSKIVHTLIDEDRKVNTSRDTTEQDIYKQFPSSYSPAIVPSFIDDANTFRVVELGLSARTDVTSDSEYNDCLREAAKQRGLTEARKITRRQAGLRYRGQIALKGVHLKPGDLIRVTNPWTGLNSTLLRVLQVTHQINQNHWETTLDVQEDESVVGGLVA